jgi:hypothetical protein
MTHMSGSSMTKKWQAKIYFTCQKILDWQAIFFSTLSPDEWLFYSLALVFLA